MVTFTPNVCRVSCNFFAVFRKWSSESPPFPTPFFNNVIGGNSYTAGGASFCCTFICWFSFTDESFFFSGSFSLSFCCFFSVFFGIVNSSKSHNATSSALWIGNAFWGVNPSFSSCSIFLMYSVSSVSCKSSKFIGSFSSSSFFFKADFESAAIFAIPSAIFECLVPCLCCWSWSSSEFSVSWAVFCFSHLSCSNLTFAYIFVPLFFISSNIDCCVTSTTEMIAETTKIT